MHIKSRLLIAVLCLLVGVRPALGQLKGTVPVDEIDRLFATWDRRDSPGCALAIIRDGKIVHERGYGMADLDHGIPITPDTVFNIASVSKQFTVFLIMLLAQAGLLSLDDDVRRHVPELPDFGKTITIRHLIHHTSGLREDWSLLGLAGWRSEDLITQRDVLGLIFRQKDLNFAPGEQHLYCNSGYQLLALIIQRVGGQPIRAYAHERIFRPLDMTATQFVDEPRLIVAKRAACYAPQKDGGFERVLYGSGRAGPGNLHTTVGDLRWDRNFYDAKVGGLQLIARMQEKGKLQGGQEIAYAGGLIVRTYRGLPIVEHGGSIAGYRTVLLRFPEQRFSVIVLANLASMKPAVLARRVADLCLAKELTPRALLKAGPPATPEMLAAVEGEYLLDSGVLLRVRRKDQVLLAQSEIVTLPLVTRDKDSFQATDGDLRLLVGTDGKLTLDTALGVQQGRKITRPTLAADKLAGFTGRYHSDELGVIHSVALRDGKLHLRDPKDESVLTPLATDAFTAMPAGNVRVVHFTRAADGQVDGLLIDTGRARKVRFAKVEWKTK